MVPRQQTAGMLGMLAGLSLAVLFVVYITSGASPQTFADPAKALPYVTENAARLRAIAVLAAVTVVLATFFVAGLAGRLRERAPTRATGVLYFGLLGIAGHGLGALVWWGAVPAVVARAAMDQVAASHAWVATNALSIALDGFGNLFTGLTILLAGWALVAGGASALGWYGVVAGILTALTTVIPGSTALVVGSFVLPVIFLLWAGSWLRTAR
ncbi:MAG: DUF4386 family protein [Armatimonadota bacterium]|nr:DUF4386 family protein [Armatimonadota bacterium]MDR7403607.1 DUF4386 family protein [Armatimonadota bacterium]